VKGKSAWKLAAVLVVVAAASFLLGYFAMLRFIL
jgi:hypothetical protein